MTTTRNTSAPSRPIGIDLFAGAGGMSLGFEQAGFDIAASVEIDPIHCAVHEYNFPNCVSICASVTDIDGAFVRKMAKLGQRDLDVVFGGAPCQGFSMIGKRALDDPRNALVGHFIRLVKELRPKYFVFENVKGLTVGKHRKFLDEIIESLSDSEYRVLLPYQVLNAAHFGVPQNRLRLFLIGVRIDQLQPKYPKPTRTISVSEAIDDLPDLDSFAELQERDWVVAKFGKGSNYARVLHGVKVDPRDFGYRRVFDRTILTSSMRTHHTELSMARFARTAYGETEPISRFHKLDPDGQCNTLRAGTNTDRGAFTSPRPIHPHFPRVISVREAARLHSYPDWFRFHVTKWHGFRQIGNSVPPLLARAVGAEIIRALGVKPQRPKISLDLGPESLLSLNMASAAKRFGVSNKVIAKRVRASSLQHAAAGATPKLFD